MATEASTADVTEPKPLPPVHNPHKKLTPFGHLLLIAAWLLPYVVQIDSCWHTILMSAVTVYVGCCRSAKENAPTDTMTETEALRFPIVGSVVLLSMFIVFKFLPKDWINLAMQCYFGLLGALAMIIVLLPFVEKLLPAKLKNMGYYRLIRLPFLKEPAEVEFTIPELVCAVPALAISGLYVWKRHYMLNNLLAISFALAGLEQVSLGSTKIGAMLLSGLFLYDIFWVFCTPVMVTVAKNFDAPAKLVLPNGVGPDGKTRFSLLGLGDIIIPGFYVSLMLRLDLASLPKKTHYFTTAWLGYIAGMGMTIFVMLHFKAAQPALLYLVPAVLLGTLGMAAVTGDFKRMWSWTEGGDVPQSEEPAPGKDTQEPAQEVNSEPKKNK